MKKILLILTAVVALACERDARNQIHQESDRSSRAVNSEENVDESSGENISPQLEDSANRFEIDTVNSAGSVNREKQEDLDENR